MEIIWDGIAKLLAEGVGFWRDDRSQKHELKKVEREAVTHIRIAEMQAKLDVLTRLEDHDAAYDIQALQNRTKTSSDELIIVTWFVIFQMHFVLFTQPYMAAGWAAMGYTAVPWWFEFGMVGILVSTLGLMRLLRVFIGKVKPKMTTAPKGQ